MNDIIEIVLFHSNFSVHSNNVLSFIKNNQINIKIINLDSKNMRNLVRSGKYFKIRFVPTLLVTYEDGNLQLFEGPKVTEWLHYFLNSNNPVNNVKEKKKPKILETPNDDYETVSEDEDSIIYSNKSVTESRNKSVMDIAKQMEKEMKDVYK